MPSFYREINLLWHNWFKALPCDVDIESLYQQLFGVFNIYNKLLLLKQFTLTIIVFKPIYRCHRRKNPFLAQRLSSIRRKDDGASSSGCGRCDTTMVPAARRHHCLYCCHRRHRTGEAGKCTHSTAIVIKSFAGF